MANEKYFRISYSCGCGANEDFLVFKNQDEADGAAYEYAVEEYDRFAGLHGIPSEADIAEDLFEKDYDQLTDAECEEVWEEYCRSCGKPLDGQWYPMVEAYERDVQSKRG